jgi:hypothetical protein
MQKLIWTTKAKWWKLKISIPSKFNEICFKLQIPYWKLLFKYKYHGNYSEAVDGEYHKKLRRK